MWWEGEGDVKVKGTLGACVDTLRQAITALDQLSVGVQW